MSIIASKIGTRVLWNRFVKFLLHVVADFTFWLSLVFGVDLDVIIKYTI